MANAAVVHFRSKIMFVSILVPFLVLMGCQDGMRTEDHQVNPQRDSLTAEISDLSKKAFLMVLLFPLGMIKGRCQSFREFYRPQLGAQNFKDRNDKNPYSESYNVGIFIGFGYTGFIGHTGGDPGVCSMMFFDPDSNIGRIRVTNTSFSDSTGNSIFYAIWDKLGAYPDKLVH